MAQLGDIRLDYLQKDLIRKTTDYGGTFSPVVKLTTVGLILAMEAHFGGSSRQFDNKMPLYMVYCRKRYTCLSHPVLLIHIIRTMFVSWTCLYMV